jgi:hypothetical protein
MIVRKGSGCFGGSVFIVHVGKFSHFYKATEPREIPDNP